MWKEIEILLPVLADESGAEKAQVSFLLFLLFPLHFLQLLLQLHQRIKNPQPKYKKRLQHHRAEVENSFFFSVAIFESLIAIEASFPFQPLEKHGYDF